MAEINEKTVHGTGCLNMLGWFLGLNLIWLLLAVFTAFLGYRSYTLGVNGQVVRGIVVRLEEDNRESSSSFNDIFPVVEFEVDGKTYSVESQNNYRWWNRYTRFPVGKQVEMRYDPSKPENAEINSWWDIWNETLILGTFTAFSAIGVNIYLLMLWRRRRNLQAVV